LRLVRRRKTISHKPKKRSWAACPAAKPDRRKLNTPIKIRSPAYVLLERPIFPKKDLSFC